MARTARSTTHKCGVQTAWIEETGADSAVASSDDETRTVRELNAEPAATEYAVAVGLDPENLSPMSFASHPLVVRVGGEYFCRSIRRLNPDGSLNFFCAIDQGLGVASQHVMAWPTNEQFRLFDADGFKRLEAEPLAVESDGVLLNRLLQRTRCATRAAAAC